MDNAIANEGRRRTVVIVGGTGDIGQAVGLAMNAAGYDLLMTYSSSKPQCLMDQQWVRMNVRDPASIREVLEKESIKSAPYGLIYCAGVLRDSPVALLKEEVWDEVMAVNLKGAFMCIRAISRSMMAARNGRIVLVGSIAGQRPRLGQAAYGASKSGLESLCGAVALEFGKYGITCNVVVPGAIESRMFRSTSESVVRNAINGSPLRRLGEARHVAGAISYLLSDDADFVTGQSVVVDGGLSLA